MAKSPRVKNSTEITFYILTLGCPKNKVDSRRMSTALLQNGFRGAKNPESADFLLINSCSFIKEAQEETISTVFEALKIKDKKSHSMKVGLIGCFVERFRENVNQEIPELDFLVGTGRYHELPQILSEKYSISLVSHSGDFMATENPDEDSHNAYAYFRIASGCSRSCAFCILPKIRGKLSKYALSDIESQWAEESYKGRTPLREAILVSQDTISSGIDNIRHILDFFETKDEVHWVRLQYLFPDRNILKLLDLYRDYPKLAAYLDLPFQHISPKILKAMNRPSDIGLFREIIQKAISMRPQLEVRTSFILGFPDETEDDVQEIYHFLENTHIHKLALFRYSHEKGTHAAQSFKDNVPEDIKIERINRLRDHHIKLRNAQRQNLVGSSVSVLVEEVNENEVVARREQDSPEIDEVVFLPLRQGVRVGDFLGATLDTPMEYDWLASWEDEASKPR